MLLGGAFVSRINMKLREEKGVTYGARSSFQFLRLAGPFSVQASIQSDATAESLRDVLVELDALGSSRPVTEDELSSARDALTRGYARGFETVEQVARAAAQLALYELPEDTFDQFSEGVAAITADDVTGMARRWLRGDDMQAVVVGEPSSCAGRPRRRRPRRARASPRGRHPRRGRHHPVGTARRGLPRLSGAPPEALRQPPSARSERRPTHVALSALR